MLAQLSSREYGEMLAAYQLNPVGQDRADLRAAIIARTVAMAGGVKDAKLADFIPTFGPDAPQTQQDMDVAMQQIAGIWK